MRQNDSEVLKQIRAVCAEYLMNILPAEMAVEEIIRILQDHMHGVQKYDKRRRRSDDHQHR